MLRALGPRRPFAAGPYLDPDVDAVRAAIAAKLELPLAKVEVIAPDVGGGFGVKIVHPWPEEMLVPGPRSGSATRQVGRGPPRALHSSAHERGQLHESGRASTTTAGSLALRGFWHDNGAYTPYGVIVPIITLHPAPGAVQARRLPGRVRALYTNTCS